MSVDGQILSSSYRHESAACTPLFYPRGCLNHRLNAGDYVQDRYVTTGLFQNYKNSDIVVRTRIDYNGSLRVIM